MVDIKLSDSEVALACLIGAMRQIQCLGGKHNHGFEEDERKGLGVAIEGAAGEIAAACVVNRYYSAPVGTFQEGGDIGDWQVRTRIARFDDPEQGLTIRKNSRDDDVYIFVVGECPQFRVVGWIYAGDAKRPEWETNFDKPNRPYVWLVPQESLRPLEELRTMPNRPRGRSNVHQVAKT